MLEESIIKLSSQLSTITRNQKYFRTRENRNFSTVRSTERRIWNFSIIEGLMMVTMAGLQVFIVRFFFQNTRKGMFSDRSNSAIESSADTDKDTCDCTIFQKGFRDFFWGVTLRVSLAFRPFSAGETWGGSSCTTRVFVKSPDLRRHGRERMLQNR